LNGRDRTANIPRVRYEDQSPSEPLSGLVKAFWRLDADGRTDRWISHQATPDGCVELICRVEGSSRWGTNQPQCFVVGLNEAPVTFEISGDSSFVAARLWPWAWNALSDSEPAMLVGKWSAVTGQSKDICESLQRPGEVERQLLSALEPGRSRLQELGLAILASTSAGDMGRKTGMSPRQLQRWFGQWVGMPPRRYLRILRFQQAFEDLHNAQLLSHHAAEHGFADQAHMARDFRRLAGDAASRIRPNAVGPFID
jgi:AraC-like DNA-binding protein